MYFPDGLEKFLEALLMFALYGLPMLIALAINLIALLIVAPGWWLVILPAFALTISTVLNRRG